MTVTVNGAEALILAGTLKSNQMKFEITGFISILKVFLT